MHQVISNGLLSSRTEERWIVESRLRSKRKVSIAAGYFLISFVLSVSPTFAAGQAAIGSQTPIPRFGHFLQTNCAFASPESPAGDPIIPDSFMYIGEIVNSKMSWPSSSAWGLEFRKSLCPHLALSMAYLNDGHFPGHHRDGVSVEAWVPFTLTHGSTFSIGAGPFYYFDTENASNPGGYADVHGWAWLFSADLRIPFNGDPYHAGWFTDVRFDWSAPAKDIETHSFALTIGYQMNSDFAVERDYQNTVLGFAENEIVAYAGKTVVNSFSSQSSFAKSVEYRRALGYEFLRGSITFVNEGDARLIRRSGVIYELWLEPSFWNGNASIGVGWGGYTAIDKYRHSPGRHVSYVVSMTLSARFLNLIPCLQDTPIAERTDFRATWHRIVTDYNRDTDILLFGVGYRFD